mmetsp:Transcript_92635/g.224892  ORF Transcript_92635/g.224892 Transcript_92635/m.224892 type:complete len:216 (+) Transcript_92635:127-774(+)
MVVSLHTRLFERLRARLHARLHAARLHARLHSRCWPVARAHHLHVPRQERRELRGHQREHGEPGGRDVVPPKRSRAGVPVEVWHHSRCPLQGVDEGPAALVRHHEPRGLRAPLPLRRGPVHGPRELDSGLHPLRIRGRLRQAFLQRRGIQASNMVQPARQVPHAHLEAEEQRLLLRLPAARRAVRGGPGLVQDLHLEDGVRGRGELGGVNWGQGG